VKQPRWIDPRALPLLHEETLAEHGGFPGLGEEATFEAALARAQHLHTYEPESDLARLAAAHGFGIVRDHPFHDGDKRVGFLAIGLFLACNGRRLSADPVEAIAIILRLAEGKLPEQELAAWIRDNLD
jgi:death-on-curing protein